MSIELGGPDSDCNVRKFLGVEKPDNLLDIEIDNGSRMSGYYSRFKLSQNLELGFVVCCSHISQAWRVRCMGQRSLRVVVMFVRAQEASKRKDGGAQTYIPTCLPNGTWLRVKLDPTRCLFPGPCKFAGACSHDPNMHGQSARCVLSIPPESQLFQRHHKPMASSKSAKEENQRNLFLHHVCKILQILPPIPTVYNALPVHGGSIKVHR